jgi:hypothetical protein
MSLVQQAGVVICRHRHPSFFVVAFMKAFQDRRAPWYLRGLSHDAYPSEHRWPVMFCNQH